MRIKAWTEAYNPFRMGGSCYYPLAVETNGSEWFDAGKGFMCGKIYSPDKTRSAIVEMRSGAIVGETVEQVMKDVAECDDFNIMEQQVKEALERISSLSTEVVTEEEFWNFYKG